MLLRYNTDAKFVVYDFETFNLCLSLAHNIPWQLSMLKGRDGKILEEKDLLLKWNTKLQIEDRVAMINHYDADRIAKIGVLPQDAFNQMYEWFTEADYIIGHNIIGFDNYFLKELCMLFGKPYKQFLPKFIDTLSIAKGMRLNYAFKPEECSFIEWQYKMANTILKGGKNKLTDLAAEFDVPLDPDRAHDASYDIVLNWHVFNKLKYQIEI